MGKFDYQRTIIAYHGCDQTVCNGVLLDGTPLQPSKNEDDWLGHGIYFWEHGPERAWEWARGRTRWNVNKPTVLGAVIQLGDCFDLLDTRYPAMLASTYRQFCRVQNDKGIPLPANTYPKHHLDCAVINWTIEFLEKQEGRKYHTVRGAFIQGGEVFPNSAIKRKSHVQIAVRRPEAIVGYFKPAIDSPAKLTLDSVPT